MCGVGDRLKPEDQGGHVAWDAQHGPGYQGLDDEDPGAVVHVAAAWFDLGVFEPGSLVPRSPGFYTCAVDAVSNLDI